jgi:hypothetical protein
MRPIIFQMSRGADSWSGVPGLRVDRRFLLMGVVAITLMSHRLEATTFRVDSSSLTVPGILGDDWRAVQHRKIWTKSDGKTLKGDPRFVRFLARDYKFTYSDAGLRLKTTWFASGKCVSTDESVKSLSGSKKRSIELAFGSLRELSLRVKETPDVSEDRVVIWAHFKSTHDVSLPVEALAGDDLRSLAPFAELARQAFETRMSRIAKCKSGEDVDKSRESTRSGGRRMRPSKSPSKSGSSMRSTPPRRTGGLIAGALPQSGTRPDRPDRRVDEQSKKQEWAILVSKFAAKPGSLVFAPVSQFTRCVLAYTEAEALAAMRAAYRPQSAAGSGPRYSYTVSSAGAGSCEKSGGSGNEDSTDSGSAGGAGTGETSGSGSTEGDGTSGSLQPFADPLSIDSDDVSDSSSGGEIDDFDLEAIPSSEDDESEMLDSEIEPAEVSSE